MCVWLSKFSCIILLVYICRLSTSETCTLNIQNDLDTSKEPLILEANGRTIVRPQVEDKAGVIHVNTEDGVILACPGRGNYNKVTRKTSSHLECSKDGTFYFKDSPDRRLDLRVDTTCQKSSACGPPKVTNRECGQGSTTGKIIQLGFQVDAIWIPQVDICFNTNGMFTLYSYHKIYGQSLDGANKDSSRKHFCVGDRTLFPQVNPAMLFLKQNDMLDEILGPGSAQKYIKIDKVYLARGHLAADADFIYKSEQQLTYSYANMAPQWQSFNNGNWRKLEDTVRRLAVQMSATLEVYTGTYGVSTLLDVDGKPQEIYLQATKRVVPVPEVFWKLVRDPGTHACVVAVGVNNVYIDSTPTPLCRTQNPQGMVWPDMRDLKKGYLYYCSYKDFKKAVPYVPEVVCSSTLLSSR